MKKIVTIFCLFSILLTTVVFSVSANEASFNTVQNESPIAKNEESEVIPEEDTVAPVEEVTEADTAVFVEETPQNETSEQKKEVITESNFCERFWGPHEVDTSYNPIAYEDLPPEVQAWLDEMKAEEEKRIEAQIEASRNRKRSLLGTVAFWDNWERFITADARNEAAKMIVEEVRASSSKLNTEAPNVSINADGKVVSDVKIVLSEEAIIKLATFYNKAVDSYIKNSFDDRRALQFNNGYLHRVSYSEEEEIWVCVFKNEVTYPDNSVEKDYMAIVLRENGELIGLGR